MSVPKGLPLSELYETISPEEFGIRIAKTFLDIRSSTAVFFMQQAFKDADDDIGLTWEPLELMLERFTAGEVGKGEPKP